MRISDWSSDVCSSDLAQLARQQEAEGSADLRIVDKLRLRFRRRHFALPLAAAQHGGGGGVAGLHRLDEAVAVAADAEGAAAAAQPELSSAERRVGEVWCWTCRSGWSRSE